MRLPAQFVAVLLLVGFVGAYFWWIVAAAVTVAVMPVYSTIASSVADADPVATTATVLKVVDADTVDIVDDVRGRLRIRLLGIDTPETKKPGYSVGCWGPQASEFAKSNAASRRREHLGRG